MIDYEYRGGKYRFYFNGIAFFEIQKKFGCPVTELLEMNGDEGFKAVIYIASVLSRQGEVYGRMTGQEPGQLLNYEKTLYGMLPSEYPAIKAAVVDAVAEGFGREHDETEADPWLAEIEAEKAEKAGKKQSPRRSMFGRFWQWASGSKRA